MKVFVLLLSTFLTACVCLATPLLEKRDFSTTIFTPPSSYQVPRTLYARSLMLTVNDNQGTLLSTWENYSGGKTWFPIYRSTDHGFTWTSLSTVTDQVNGWGLRYQPILYELKESFAGYAAGSILLAGNSIPSDLSKTQLDLYISTDKGSTWTFLSHIASGGEADPVNGKTPVWEPFLLVNNGQLHCFYSDQRDPKYGQKIVHQSTSDLKTWGAVINDMADVSDSDARPGMPVIAQIGNGNFMMTFEYCGKNNCNVHYKITSNPSSSWENIAPVQLITQDGVKPFSSPFVVWTPIGALNGNTAVKTPSGTIVVNSYSSGELYLNKQNGNPNAWTRLSTSSPAQYSRSLAVGFNPKDITIVGGGVLNGQHNTVTLYARDVNGCSTCT